MAKALGDPDLDQLLNRQRRLIIAGAAFRRGVVATGRPSPADLRAALLLAADLRRTLAALEGLRDATGLAVGQAVVGRAASLAYLTVGRAAGRPH